MTAFIIDKDHLYERYHTGRSDVGTIGPSNVSDRDVERLKAGEGVQFRLYDDDGELYYTGHRLEVSDADADYDAEPELAPLDCFGMPNAGCTDQREKNADGAWVSL